MMSRSLPGNDDIPAYIVERGIQPWDWLPGATAADCQATVTIATHGGMSLVSLLGTVLDALAPSFPRLIRWHTAGVPFRGNSLQSRRFFSEMSSPLPGFGDIFLDAPDPHAITCNASHLLLPFTREHFDALSAYTSSILVMSRSPALTPQDVCTLFRPFASGLRRTTTEVAISSILAAMPDLMVTRAYDDGCAHCAWQFFGLCRNTDDVVEALRGRELKELAGRDEVATFLRSGAQAS